VEALKDARHPKAYHFLHPLALRVLLRGVFLRDVLIIVCNIMLCQRAWLENIMGSKFRAVYPRDGRTVRPFRVAWGLDWDTPSFACYGQQLERLQPVYFIHTVMIPYGDLVCGANSIAFEPEEDCLCPDSCLTLCIALVHVCNYCDFKPTLKVLEFLGGVRITYNS